MTKKTEQDWGKLARENQAEIDKSKAKLTFEELTQELNEWKKIMDKIMNNDVDDEVEHYTCCNIEITSAIRDMDRCPVCMENL
tara:strand:+ start:438 stop:686 length:249 start_codon:yes stop_codon:yes gene_type:complete